MITRLDEEVGRVLRKIKDLGIEENTIIVFSSDNGPHKEGGADPKFFGSAGPLRGYKRALYEGGIRVPMIVRWARRQSSGRVWLAMPSGPLLGYPTHVVRNCRPPLAPSGIDGISQVATLLGKPDPPRHDFLYWEFHEGGFKQAVRHGDWKAVRIAQGKPLELYNLKADVGETHDIAREHTDVVARIEAYLKTACTDSPEFRTERRAVEFPRWRKTACSRLPHSQRIRDSQNYDINRARSSPGSVRAAGSRTRAG